MTRREIISLIALGVLMITLALLFQFTSFKMTKGWEVFFIVFFGFPLGYYFVTDPERINRKGK